MKVQNQRILKNVLLLILIIYAIYFLIYVKIKYS